MDPTNPDDPTGSIQLSTDATGDPLAWSSDGSKLLIRRSSRRDGSNAWELSVLHVDGTSGTLAPASLPETPLVDGASFRAGGSFSPDGSEVVYATLADDFQSGIYVVSSDGGTPRLVLPSGRRYVQAFGRSVRTMVYHPAFSPDGTQIAYFDGVGDHSHSLWVMNADGSDRRLLVDFGGRAGHVSGVAWSPDGEQLATGLSDALYTVRLDGSGLTLVARSPDNEAGTGPQWSPDGSRIAFVQSFGPRKFDRNLVTIGADGSDQRIVQGRFRGRTIAWNPAG